MLVRKWGCSVGGDSYEGKKDEDGARTLGLEEACVEEARVSFATSKWAIASGVGCVYFFSFLSAYHQNCALVGERGLSPGAVRVERLRPGSGYEDWRRFVAQPSVWYFTPFTDESLQRVCVAGLALSAFAALGGHFAPVFAALWLLHFSLVLAGEGSSFYSYGWESQLLEAGFLTVFLCGVCDCAHRPTLPVLYLFRWLCFRVSVGAGLRGAPAL